MTPKPMAPQRHRPSTFTATVDLGRYGPALRDQVLALISLQRDSGRAGLGVLILRMFSWIEDHHIDDLNDPAFLEVLRAGSSDITAWAAQAVVVDPLDRSAD